MITESFRPVEDELIEKEALEILNDGLQNAFPKHPKWIQVIRARFFEVKKVSEIKSELGIVGVSHKTDKAMHELRKWFKGRGY